MKSSRKVFMFGCVRKMAAAVLSAAIVLSTGLTAFAAQTFITPERTAHWDNMLDKGMNQFTIEVDDNGTAEIRGWVIEQSGLAYEMLKERTNWPHIGENRLLTITNFQSLILVLADSDSPNYSYFVLVSDDSVITKLDDKNIYDEYGNVLISADVVNSNTIQGRGIVIDDISFARGWGGVDNDVTQPIILKSGEFHINTIGLIAEVEFIVITDESQIEEVGNKSYMNDFEDPQIVARYSADMLNSLVNATGTPAPTETNTTPTTSQSIATPTASKVYINGTETAFDAYNINDSDYFKLRDLAYSVNGTEKQFDVAFDATANAINLLSNKAYTVTSGEMAKSDGQAKESTLTTSKIMLDGKEIELTAYNIGDNNYFKLRDIAKTFNFSVAYDNATNAITIDTANPYTE